ncbi:hypothetical protein P148_SR1C00001G0099 [candidate division SR1 bacterium RAAC1_SR1_1]|nr:hypothetical protein P148_SR1C00001G0099 [candidate division SR1 bacterium RAAC1_SR1_1]
MSKNINKSKFIILLVGFLDILGIGIVIPTLPDLAAHYGVSAHLISYGITGYALAAFLAAPILGQISDVIGRKKVLIVCVIGSFLSAFMIAISPVFIFFLIGRIINGLTGGNISVLQAIIADISPTKQERSANMGMLGALFGSAFIVGPLTGAALLHFGVMVPYWFMAALSLIEIFVIIFAYSETNLHQVTKKIIYNPIKQIITYIRKPVVNSFIVSFFILLTGFALYQSLLSLYLTKEYGVSGSFSGYLMAGTGIIMVLNQVFLLKRFWLKKFSLKQLLYILNFGVLVVFILMSIVHPLPWFISLFVLLVPLQSLIQPIYSSEIMEHADPNAKGQLMGVMSSVQSMSMFVGPLLGGFLLDHNISIFMVSAIIVCGSIFLVMTKIRHVIAKE